MECELWIIKNENKKIRSFNSVNSKNSVKKALYCSRQDSEKALLEKKKNDQSFNFISVIIHVIVSQQTINN